MDKEFAKPFIRIIEKKVRKTIKEMGLPSTRIARVASVNADGTIDVSIPPNETTIHNLKSISNETLSVNDSVFLLLIDGSISNAVVWIKRN